MTSRSPLLLHVMLAAGILIALHGCTPQTATENQDLEFKSRSAAIKAVIVIGPDVQIVRRETGGQEVKLTDYNMRVSAELVELIANAFSQRGFEAKGGPLTESIRLPVVSAYDELAYRQSISDLHPALGDRHSLGSGIGLIAKQTGADALVFIKFQGLTRSSGSVASEIAKKAAIVAFSAGLIQPEKAPAGSTLLDVAFVDGKTGHVLWENRDKEVWGWGTRPTFNREELSDMTTKVFANFPS